MSKQLIKRDGKITDYSMKKIATAIGKAFGPTTNSDVIDQLTQEVDIKLSDEFYTHDMVPTVENVQDIVVATIRNNGYIKTASKYDLYRKKREAERDKTNDTTRALMNVLGCDADESNEKRDNANIDGDSSMGSMLQIGSVASQNYYLKHVLPDDMSSAHMDGDIHIHDLDFYALTTTCCQIDIGKLFSGGFGTGHGFIREPKSIMTASSLAAIAVQSNQNDQHGGQSIPMLDYGLAPYIAVSFVKTYKRLYKEALYIKDEDMGYIDMFFTKAVPKYDISSDDEKKKITKCLGSDKSLPHHGTDIDLDRIYDLAVEHITIETKQAMESFIHNLNTLHSRAGGQVPFSSINYGTDTSPEGRLLIKSVLEATRAGMGHGETPIFPIQVFKLKEGVNYNPEDPNYDLFQLAIKTSSERLFPNFAFLDAPHNKPFYKAGKPETECVYMGCRTRVMSNMHDPDQEIVTGRGNLSFTSINLPRLAIRAMKQNEQHLDYFFEALGEKLELVYRQLWHRFQIQASKKVKNYPFLMGQGVWLDSDTLTSPNDTVGEVLKHGSLSIGFIGLAETLTMLIGSHHGETEEARELGLKIIGYMRDFTDMKATETGLNFSLLATPAEGLSGRFVRMDKKRYGEIPGVTDRDYYTNGFHVPVYHSISAFEKIKIEGPYHALTNAGHISYIELDGNARNNPSAFEAIIRYMKESGIGYGSINHPLDSCPACGYHGIINDECPECGVTESDDVRFDRIRRITGYLTGTLDRWNDAKRAEESDRLKHNL